ncbi:MAG TPA: hypothetical protein VE619_04725, partial [Nitrososphaeraceae archaeon]|nr:hypothetical protein [Nitrososphaeraceae archaeon]
MPNDLVSILYIIGVLVPCFIFKLIRLKDPDASLKRVSLHGFLNYYPAKYINYFLAECAYVLTAISPETILYY